jgi:hypothetical protein
MKILTIVPDQSRTVFDDGYIRNHNYDKDELVRASFCYLHGELDELNGFDCFFLLKSELSDDEVDGVRLSDNFKEGVYPCVCLGRESTFFRWHRGRGFCGLVVSNDDTEAYAEAHEMYLNKEISF